MSADIEQNAPLDESLEAMRTELLQLDEEKKQLIEEREKLMVKVRLNPGWGIDEEGYPDPNFPHIDQAHVRSRIGKSE